MTTFPRWLIEKRFRTCQVCFARIGCKASNTLFEELPSCPLNAHHSAIDELRWEKAWPQHVKPVSGCCDSALNPAL